jgi:hypothetical protein
MPGTGPGQFTHRSLFVATALVALACASAFCPRYPAERAFSWPAVSVLLGGAVGVLYSRPQEWMLYGVGVEVSNRRHLVALASRLTPPGRRAWLPVPPACPLKDVRGRPS